MALKHDATCIYSMTFELDNSRHSIKDAIYEVNQFTTKLSTDQARDKPC